MCETPTLGRRSIVFRRLGHNRSPAHLNPSVEASIHKDYVLIVQNLELEVAVSFMSFHQPERFNGETSLMASIVVCQQDPRQFEPFARRQQRLPAYLCE